MGADPLDRSMLGLIYPPVNGRVGAVSTHFRDVPFFFLKPVAYGEECIKADRHSSAAGGSRGCSRSLRRAFRGLSSGSHRERGGLSSLEQTHRDRRDYLPTGQNPF